MILIVDDDSPLGAGLERMFRYAGFDAVAIQDGAEALELLNLRRPKLVILDLHMPGIDGMTLLRAIRSDRQFQQVPVIMYTADFSMLMERKALEAGAQALIVKGTVGWDRLLERAREMMDREPPLRMTK